MPTAAKFVAAVLLAALAYYASELVKELMTDRDRFGPFSLVNAGIGALTGWLSVGARAGHGMSAAISNGVTGVVSGLFCCLAVHSIDEMVERAFDRRYDSMIEAAASVFELMVEFAAVLVDLNFALTLVAGAIVVGYLTELTARNWR
ncbi:hypothetical protein ROJ8625_02019 [Roseivivax jejudonensis]|uniref:Tellurium resistance protein n=1 Tax=Roseivivax jejudonensis TaxID=1529041 RepID=A0A1X6Z609_9RHOB|nr:TrgA family protein [Roseivivax jejudonensis]SLN41822.1 hypothetical protein ROJ8625_02019 [Roseivivax jejudonensis]